MDCLTNIAPTGGYVGVGVSSPGAPLDVNATSLPIASTNGIVAISSKDTGAIGKGGTASFGGKIDGGATLYSFGIIGGFKENATSGNEAGYLAFGTRANGSLPAERMRISSAGYLGVGTTAPSYRLDSVDNSVAAIRAQRTDSANTRVPAFIVSRSRGDTTAPDVGFGVSMDFEMEGFTDGSMARAANIEATWNNTQTNDTTSRNSNLVLRTMYQGTLYDAVRITPTAVVGINVYPVSGNILDVLGGSSFGSYAGVTAAPTNGIIVSGRVGIGNNAPAAQLHVTSAHTSTSGTVFNDLNDMTASPASASSANFIAKDSSLSLTGSQNLTGGSTAVNAEVHNTNTGTATTLRANYGYLANESTGTISNAFGFNGEIINSSTGTISNAYGLYSKVTQSSGTILNGYGLYLTTIQGTNKFSIYAADATAPSYLAGNLGIGTTSPIHALEVVDNGNDALVKFTDFSNTYSGDIRLYRARGTQAGPSALASGDIIGGLNFFAYGSSAVPAARSAAMEVITTEAITTSAKGSAILFKVAANGSTTTPEALRIHQNGYLGIANSSPTKLLHVGSAATSTGTAVANFQNVDGTCTITPASSGSGIACSSDERLKENFEDVSGRFALDRLLRLQAVTYNFKTASVEDRKTGYRAQQVRDIAPEFVRENDDGFLQVYYDAFIPWITEAIKVLYKGHQQNDARLRQLEAENAELRVRLEKIETALREK